MVENKTRATGNGNIPCWKFCQKYNAVVNMQNAPWHLLELYNAYIDNSTLKKTTTKHHIFFCFIDLTIHNSFIKK